MLTKQMFELGGQVAFVTGAARGLGREMAEAVAEAGATVVMTDVDREGIFSTCEELNARGYAVHPKVVDASDLQQVRQAIDAAASQFGRLDITFANAALSAGPGPFTEEGAIENIDMDRWNSLLNLNLTSVLTTIQTSTRHMRPARSGRIIVTASIAGIRAERMVGYAYVATKAAVCNLVRQSCLELSRYGININAIAPGPFKTDIGGSRLRKADIAQEFALDVPMGRIGEPHEIKGLALLLASSASSFMTGTVIPIDGGATAW